MNNKRRTDGGMKEGLKERDQKTISDTMEKWATGEKRESAIKAKR